MLTANCMLAMASRSLGIMYDDQHTEHDRCSDIIYYQQLSVAVHSPTAVPRTVYATTSTDTYIYACF
jgi:hypothetical protein